MDTALVCDAKTSGPSVDSVFSVVPSLIDPYTYSVLNDWLVKILHIFSFYHEKEKRREGNRRGEETRGRSRVSHIEDTASINQTRNFVRAFSESMCHKGKKKYSLHMNERILRMHGMSDICARSWGETNPADRTSSAKIQRVLICTILKTSHTRARLGYVGSRVDQLGYPHLRSLPSLFICLVHFLRWWC